MAENDDCSSCGKEPREKAGWMRRLTLPPNCSLRRILAIGLIGGIIVWGGLNTGMELTNHTEFCISCHEMRIPFEDFKKTVHYTNRSGTTVACADCHVASSKNPIDYGRKFTMKLLAAGDVVGHLTGRIDTTEKFEERRLQMAKAVWKRMKAADSKECRNCHDFNTMDKSKQKDRAVVKHEDGIEDGKTCIDCHKGIAHKAVHTKLSPEELAREGL